MNKSAWAPGPWQDEPDSLAWTDERTGLPCRIIRNMLFGTLCGYAGVPPTHPYYGWQYDDAVAIEQRDRDGTIDDVGAFNAFVYALGGGDEHGTIPLGMTLKAHQGISWSGELPIGDEDGLWFFGFDCGHAWDIAPGFPFQKLFDELPLPGRRYRDIEYVKKEVTSLAFQLRQLETRVLVDDNVLKWVKP